MSLNRCCGQMACLAAGLLLTLAGRAYAQPYIPNWDSRNISAAEWTCDASGGGVTATFNGGSVTCGSELLQSVTTFSGAPIVSWSGAADGTYSIVIVDRDARSPSEPLLSPLRHYATSRVAGSALRAGVNISGGLWFNYSGPQPPAGTGCHRYYLIVYSENGEVLGPTNASRFNWNWPTWAADNRLTRRSANYWSTQNEAARTGGCAATSAASRVGVQATVWAALALMAALIILNVA